MLWLYLMLSTAALGMTTVPAVALPVPTLAVIGDPIPSMASSWTHLATPWRPPRELVDLMRARIPGQAPALVRLRRLHHLLISPRELEIRQVSDWSGSSEEVWRERRADCVGFAYLLAGLARELAIDVGFVIEQRGERTTSRIVPGDESRPPQRLVRKEAHLAVIHHSTRGESWVIDHGGFRRDVEGLNSIQDSEAAALLWANRGARALLAGECLEASRYARKAAALAPDFSTLQENLRIVEKRCRIGV